MTRNLKVAPRKILLILTLLVIAVFISWNAIRLWLTTAPLTTELIIHLIDITLIIIIGTIIILVLSQIIIHYVGAYVGYTQSNAIRSWFQIIGFLIILLIVSSIAGINLFSTLVGLGFFGIIIGLAAQAVLGNIFSGLMLFSTKPFQIGDRIAMVTWQYGKFPPTLAHGWLEPSYTGLVKEITLIYTKIITDSNALVIVPNGIVSQSLILNLSHNFSIGTQFEVPIHINPEEFHKNLNSQLSKMPDFHGKEENFEIIEISSSAYIVSINYRVDKNSEREKKTLLLKALRLALINTNKQ